TTANNDYVGIPLTPITIPAGMLSKTIDVTVNGDVTAETDETFTVHLSGANNAGISVGNGTGTILNDDGAVPFISIDRPRIAEGNSGSTNLTFTVSLSAAATTPITVGYATANGTATTSSGIGGLDYVGASGTVAFAIGEQFKTIDVQVNGDINNEADETF